MRFRKVGRHSYPIQYPSLDNYYNAIYSITYNKIYYGCPKQCLVCAEWKKKNQIWKVFAFFPIHCHFCCYAGNTEDFERVNIFIVCNRCYKNLVTRKNKLLYFQSGRFIKN